MLLHQKKITRILGVVIAVFIYLFLFVFSIWHSGENVDSKLINDVSRLNPTRILDVQSHQDVGGIKTALKYAQEHDLKISIAGKQHSMGGHTFYEDAVVLDMTEFNEILAVDPLRKTVIVQSGATWDQVIEQIHPHGLALKVLQDYSGFTVGGSMSVNVHQSDPHFGPMVETIESFRLLTADGEILQVSREENPDLFSLVIGGYGLFGVILDATLQLTDDGVYQKEERIVAIEDYNDIFRRVQSQKDIENVFARLSFVPGDRFLKDLAVTVHRRVDSEFDRALLPDQNVGLKKFIFGLSRHADWGKKVRWHMQTSLSHLVEPPLITRNNLDKQDLSFLRYVSRKDTDILQEYFVPRDQLTAFVDTLRETVAESNANLLSATIRYVPKNTETVLSYSASADELFGVVLYFNVGLSERDQEYVRVWTGKLIETALDLNGTFYLPYELYATKDQLMRAYPRFDEFVDKKKAYDPDERFMNQFYETYAD